MLSVSGAIYKYGTQGFASNIYKNKSCLIYFLIISSLSPRLTDSIKAVLNVLHFTRRGGFLEAMYLRLMLVKYLA